MDKILLGLEVWLLLHQVVYAWDVLSQVKLSPITSTLVPSYSVESSLVLRSTPDLPHILSSRKTLFINTQNASRPMLPGTSIDSSIPASYFPSVLKPDVKSRSRTITTTISVFSVESSQASKLTLSLPYIASHSVLVSRNKPTRSTPTSMSSSIPAIQGKPDSKAVPLIVIAASAGSSAFVILILVVIIIFCWYRRKIKFKREKEMYDKYFAPSLVTDVFSDATAEQDNNDDTCVPQVRLLDVCQKEDPNVYPLSFQGFSNKAFDKPAASGMILLDDHQDSSNPTAEVENKIDCCSLNEPENQDRNQEVTANTTDVDHLLNGSTANLSTDKEIKPDTSNKELSNPDTSILAKPVADTSIPDYYRDSLLILQSLDDLLESECVTTPEVSVQENTSSSGEATTILNGEAKPENCEQDFVVLYPYCAASNMDQVTLDAGVIVSVVESNSSGWSWVTNIDVGAGWFPSRYLQPVSEGSGKTSEAEQINTDDQSANDNDYLLPNRSYLNKAKVQKRDSDFIVLHSFCASNADELTLEKDDVVSVIQNRSSGWSWVTSVFVGTGWFPTSYLKPLDRSTNTVNKDQLVQNDSAHSLSSDKLNLANFKDDKHSPEFFVLHSFCASNADELTLEKDDVVSVIQNRSSGWSWVTSIYVGTGWFPTSYLKPLDRSTNMLNEPDEEHSDEDDHEYLQVNEELDEDGLPQKSEYVYARPSEIQEIKNKGHYQEYNAIACRANHSYESSNKNELSFKENQTILVLEETESGWWRGSTYFEEGWFPATYVKVPAEGQDEKIVDKDCTESQAIKQQDSHYEVMDQLSKQNRVPNRSESCEDVSPYQVTDLMSSNTHQFAEIPHQPSLESSLESTEPRNNPKKSAKGKRRRRPPPIPPVKKESNSEQEVNSSTTINEAEEGVVILSNSDQPGCALSKLIRITKRLSTTNPAQSNLGPPPDRPVPIPPPRKSRKTLSSADHNKEKQRVQRPQIIPRNVKKKNIENIPNDVPKRPPPPTPDKLKEYRRNNLSNVSPVAHETFTDKHWSKTKQKRPQRHSSTNDAEDEDLKICELDVNGNSTSTKDCVDMVYPGTTGNNFMKKNKDLPSSTVGEPIEEQKIRASPKPRQRKHTQSNEKEDYEIQPSLNDKNILENSEGNLRLTGEPSIDLSLEPSSLAMKLTDKNLNKEEMSAHATEVTGKSQFPAKQSSSGNSDAKETTSEIERTPTCEVAPSTPPKNKPEVRKRSRQEQVLTQAPEVPPRNHSLAKDNLTSMKLEHEMGRNINVEETATQLPEVRPRSLCKAEENLPTTPTKDREMNLEYTRTNISKDMPRQQSTTEQKDRVTNTECRTATSPDVLPRLSRDNQPQPVQEKSLDQERPEDKFNRPKPKPRTKKQKSVN